ncbi:7-cyano-7-deazaguanine synthase QueC [Stenotrophomonas sp.]|uniref:7-cyano-7-deazaguanine synthase QueC n=1 Tax=Stenotrophomonas sp. TaxID=69392 RepID=UPI002FCC5B36
MVTELQSDNGGIDQRSALVVFSGGQDSATCLAWALDRFDHVETLGFHYGQVHDIEMSVREGVREAIRNIRPEWKDRLGPDHVHDAGIIGEISQSELTGASETKLRTAGLPATFVPGRNLVFLTLAAALAYRRGAKHIVTGVCETDFSGYPDCRDDTIKAVQLAVNLGMESRFVVHTPLMWITKAQSWSLAEDLGGSALVSAINEKTHTCYTGDRSVLHDWGYGCGKCDACRLRATGWKSYVEGNR